MTDGITHLGEDEMRRFEQSWAQNPGLGKMRHLIVSYARSQGGLTLAYWERDAGHYFGKPIIMRTDRITEELGVEVSELERISKETWAWVKPRLDADPDFQETMRSADPTWGQAGGGKAADGSQLPALKEPDDHTELDGVLLPLAIEFAEGSAGDFLETVKARYDVHRWVVARWLWSADERGLIVESAPNHSAFRVVPEQASERLEEVSPDPPP
jgi:hypothetical protein